MDDSLFDVLFWVLSDVFHVAGTIVVREAHHIMSRDSFTVAFDIVISLVVPEVIFLPTFLTEDITVSVLVLRNIVVSLLESTLNLEFFLIVTGSVSS